MPIHDIQKRRQYYKERYHKLKPQKQTVLSEQPINEENDTNDETIEQKKQDKQYHQYSNNLNKYTFKPIITIPNNNPSLDDVLTDDKPTIKAQYVSDKLSFYTKLSKLFFSVKDPYCVIEDIVVKHGFDPEDTDEMYDFFKMIDRKLTKEEKIEKLEKFNKPWK